IAVPAALASHFVCDSLPHYGDRSKGEALLRTKGYRNYLITDASLCVALVSVLAVTRPEHWLLAAICAFVATSPDLVWLRHYLNAIRKKKWKPMWFERFASDIQWFERPIGSVVEAAWLLSGLIVLSPLLR
ncbi:MAG: hypothetical protein JWL89_407, partial [Candidatus Saccharibacteria bacterium]|nr:hypothetical protein [Candidatus Saccharibacteria bacterium]